jgi:hypothetical protein
MFGPELQKLATFSEIQRKPAESGRSELQNRRILFTVSKFQKKIKISKKYVKKTRSNSNVTSEEIFLKSSHLDG